MLKVIGAGFGRTGTLSLKNALEFLGVGRCYHMMEVFANPSFPRYWEKAAMGEQVDWDEVFKGYSAAVDWPACNHYRELAAHYPQGKVILTYRDPDAWFTSTQNTIFKDLEKTIAERNDDWARMVEKSIVKLFNGRIHDRDHCIAVYERHNEAVRREIPAERLLIYQASEGWEPLCRFLGLTVPDAPFPKINTTEDFRRMAESRRPD